MKTTSISLAIALLILAGCAAPKQTGTSGSQSTSLVNGGKVWSSLWQQRAAEYRALCFQAYNLARLRLDEALRQPAVKPLAVITDIDETLLDNSPYDAARAVLNLDYDLKTWKAWTAKGIADTVPGAPAFFKYAASKGVTVFYITNREEDERTGTTKNLLLYGLPFADESHLLLKNGSSSKENRRQQVMQTYKVALLCGDNLPDFDAVYDNHPTEISRNLATTKLQQQFGNRYIVIPNPSYGDFEGALFNFNYKLNTAQKDSVIKALLKTDK